MYSLPTYGVLALLSLVPQCLAQSKKYTVWSSVIFSRTGERTPVMLGDMNSILTPLGANQSYTAGSFMRDRYFGDYTANGVPDVGGAPIQGLSGNTFDVDQVYIGCQDIQYTAASAQAFLQGFYPPLDQGDGDTSDQDDTTPSSMNKLADGTTVSITPSLKRIYGRLIAYCRSRHHSTTISTHSSRPTLRTLQNMFTSVQTETVQPLPSIHKITSGQKQLRTSTRIV